MESYRLESDKTKADPPQILTGYINFGLEKEDEADRVEYKSDKENVGDVPVVKSFDLDNAVEESESVVESKPRTCVRQYAGMMLTFMASFLFSVIVLLVKLLQPYGVNSGNVSFWRYAGITIPSLPLLVYFNTCGRKGNADSSEGKSVFSTVWPLTDSAKFKTFIGLLVRGVLGCSSVIFRYYALEYLSIGDTSVISYSSPVLVTILAHFFLGEKTGFVPIGAALLTLGGVVVILRPPIITGEPLSHETLIGTGFALGSLCCNAVMTVITRKIREVQFALMLVTFGTIGMIQAFAMSSYSGGLKMPTEFYEMLMLGGVFAMSFFGQMCILLALKFEQAGPVALIRTCDVIFGFLLQFAFLHVVPDLYSGIGGSIVFFCILLIATRKWMSSLPKTHSARKTCLLQALYDNWEDDAVGMIVILIVAVKVARIKDEKLKN